MTSKPKHGQYEADGPCHCGAAYQSHDHVDTLTAELEQARAEAMAMRDLRDDALERVVDARRDIGRLEQGRAQALESGQGFVSHFASLVRQRDAAEHAIPPLIDAVNFLMNCRSMDVDDETWNDAAAQANEALSIGKSALAATSGQPEGGEVQVIDS